MVLKVSLNCPRVYRWYHGMWQWVCVQILSGHQYWHWKMWYHMSQVFHTHTCNLIDICAKFRYPHNIEGDLRKPIFQGSSMSQRFDLGSTVSIKLSNCTLDTDNIWTDLTLLLSWDCNIAESQCIHQRYQRTENKRICWEIRNSAKTKTGALPLYISIRYFLMGSHNI